MEFVNENYEEAYIAHTYFRDDYSIQLLTSSMYKIDSSRLDKSSQDNTIKQVMV